MKYLYISILFIFSFTQISAQDKNQERLLDLAFAALDSLDYELSIVYFDSLIVMRPDVWILYSEKGRAQTQLAQYNKAIETLKKALELSPENEIVMLHLGNAYHFGEYHKEYLELRKLEYEKYPTDVEIIVDYASALYRMGDYKKAFEYLYKAEDINKKDLNVQSLIGFMLKVLGDTKQAEKHFKKVANKSKDSFSKLIVLSEINEKEKANELLEELIAENPEDPYNYEMKASFLAEEGKFEAAIINFKKALAFQSHPNASLADMTYCFIRLEKYDEAIEILEPLIEEYPSFYKAKVNYCRALIGKGELEKVKSIIDEAIDLKPLQAYGYFVKGLLYLELNDQKLACDSFSLAQKRYFEQLYPTENLGDYIKKCKN